MYAPRMKKASTAVDRAVGPRPDQRSGTRSRPLQVLQRALGNESFGVLQAKLTLGQPGDRYEQEADRVADTVMSMPEPRVQRQGEVEEDDELQAKRLAGQITPLVQRQGELKDEEEEVQAKPVAESITPLVQRQEVPEEDEDEPVQAKLDGQVQREVEEEDEEPLQAKAGPSQATALDGGTEGRIRALRGRGQPLDRKTRAFMEPRFGYSFADVRVHAGWEAAGLARDLNAKAFSVGRDVAFADGQYAPRSVDGRLLLAHELTHVVQQGRSPNRLSLSGKSQRVNFPATTRKMTKRSKIAMASPSFEISIWELAKCILPGSYPSRLTGFARTATTVVKLAAFGKVMGIKFMSPELAMSYLTKLVRSARVAGALAKVAGPAATVALTVDACHCLVSVARGTKYQNHVYDFLVKVAVALSDIDSAIGSAIDSAIGSAIDSAIDKYRRFLNTNPVDFVNWLMSRLVRGW